MDLAGNIKEEKKGFISFLLFLSLLQLLPFFILKEGVSIPINDTMDVYIPQYKYTATKEFAFCSFDKQVPQIMNGLNRDLLVSDLNVIYILFLTLKPFWAFTINLLLIKLVAFIGMFLFLKNNFNSLNQKQIAIAAFLYSCIPFWPIFGIGIAGQPLLANTLINFYKKRVTYLDFIVLFLFPFYSSLVFTNIFIVLTSFLFCAYFIWSNKKIPFQLIFATSALLLLGVLADYRLFHASLSPGFIPHRVEFDFGAFVNQTGIIALFKAAFKILFTGIFHVETFYSVFVFAIFILYFFSIKNYKPQNIIMATLGYIVLISLIFGLTHSSYYSIITHKITFLKAFQIDRFYTLLPFLYFLLAIGCIQMIIKNANKLKINILNITIVLAMFVLFFNSYPLRALVNDHDHTNDVIPTYSEYYDSEIIEQVRQTIPSSIENYRIAGVGIDPGVLQYHGFYTLDAYLNIYPLEYKKKFRPVIANELAKSADIKTYFDSWGNRCYIFSSEIGKDLNKQSREIKYINELNIDGGALKALYNGDIYLLSTKSIRNFETLGLKPIKEFYSANKFRNYLILYKVL